MPANVPAVVYDRFCRSFPCASSSWSLGDPVRGGVDIDHIVQTVFKPLVLP